MYLKNYIRNKRIEKGLTQKELAESVGCSERTIRRLENQEYIKDTNIVKNIGNLLGFKTSNIEIKGNTLLNFEDNNDIVNELGFNNSKEVFNTLKKNLKQAYELSEKKNYSEALKIYLAVSKLFGSERIYLKIATLYYNMGKYEKCIEFAEKYCLLNSYK